MMKQQLKDLRKEISALKAYAENPDHEKKVTIKYEDYLALLEFQEAVLKKSSKGEKNE